MSNILNITISELRNIIRNELNEAEIKQFDSLKGLTNMQNVIILSSVENPNEILKKAGQSGVIFLSPFTDKVLTLIR